MASTKVRAKLFLPKPIRISSSDEFAALLEALARDVVDANIHALLLADLLDAVSEYSIEFNQSLTFWNLTLAGQQDAVLVRLCRAYDSHSASLSLPRLLATIEVNLQIFGTVDFKNRLKGNAFVDSLTSESRIPDLAQLKSDIAAVSGSDPLVQR